MFDVIRMWNEMMGCVSSKLGGCLKQLASVSGSGNWKLLNVMLEVVQHPAPTGEIMWVFYIESVNEIIKNYFNIFLRLNIFCENQIELHKASCRAPLPPSRQLPLTHRSKLCVDFWPQTNSTLCCSLCLVGVKYQVSSIKFSVKYQNQTKLHVEKNKASQRAPLAPKNSSLCCSHCLAGVKHQVSNIKYQVWSV